MDELASDITHLNHLSWKGSHAKQKKNLLTFSRVLLYSETTVESYRENIAYWKVTTLGQHSNDSIVRTNFSSTINPSSLGAHHTVYFEVEKKDGGFHLIPDLRLLKWGFFKAFLFCMLRVPDVIQTM